MRHSAIVCALVLAAILPAPITGIALAQQEQQAMAPSTTDYPSGDRFGPDGPYDGPEMYWAN